MKVIIDRFEGDFAVVELPDLTLINVPKSLFPNAQEHDVIDITIDEHETESRKRRIKDLMSQLLID